MESSLIDKVRAIEPALRRQGVTHLAIFGSRARGDHRPDSDIDVLLDVAPEFPFSLIHLVRVEQLIEKTLGYPANAFMHRSLKPDFRREIAADLRSVF